MKEKLAAIDTSSIEELQRIKVEQDIIDERLLLLKDKRDDVSAEVFDRVHLDYSGQVKGLEENAKPLKVQARAQYVILKKLLVEIDAFVKTSEMDREELHLRNELGEFSEETFATHLKDCEDRTARHQDNLSEAQALRERFLLAFHSEEELEEGSQEAEIEEALEAESEVVPEPEEEGPTVEEMLEEAELPPEPPPFPEDDEVIEEELEEIEAAPDGETMVLTAAEVSEHTEAAVESILAPEGATMILSWPKLIMQNAMGDIQELTVAGVSATIVGSDEACDIVVSGVKVAGRHAEISLNDKGYLIRDLSTPVGTLVNGVEITEWNLSDGDTIQLGDVSLMFREN